MGQMPPGRGPPPNMGFPGNKNQQGNMGGKKTPGESGEEGRMNRGPPGHPMQPPAGGNVGPPPPGPWYPPNHPNYRAAPAPGIAPPHNRPPVQQEMAKKAPKSKKNKKSQGSASHENDQEDSAPSQHKQTPQNHHGNPNGMAMRARGGVNVRGGSARPGPREVPSIEPQVMAELENNQDALTEGEILGSENEIPGGKMNPDDENAGEDLEISLEDKEIDENQDLDQSDSDRQIVDCEKKENHEQNLNHGEKSQPPHGHPNQGQQMQGQPQYPPQHQAGNQQYPPQHGHPQMQNMGHRMGGPQQYGMPPQGKFPPGPAPAGYREDYPPNMQGGPQGHPRPGPPHGQFHQGPNGPHGQPQRPMMPQNQYARHPQNQNMEPESHPGQGPNAQGGQMGYPGGPGMGGNAHMVPPQNQQMPVMNQENSYAAPGNLDLGSGQNVEDANGKKKKKSKKEKAAQDKEEDLGSEFGNEGENGERQDPYV